MMTCWSPLILQQIRPIRRVLPVDWGTQAVPRGNSSDLWISLVFFIYFSFDFYFLGKQWRRERNENEPKWTSWKYQLLLCRQPNGLIWLVTLILQSTVKLKPVRVMVSVTASHPCSTVFNSQCGQYFFALIKSVLKLKLDPKQLIWSYKELTAAFN